MDYPFIKCLNPVKIVNQHNYEPLVVGCGKCAACRLQKSSLRTLKCKLESQTHRWSYFITLTFAPNFIPRMNVMIDDSTGWQQKKKFIFYDDAGTILAEHYYCLSDYSELLKKVKMDAIPYLDKRLAQLFMKRLRKHLSKYTDERIRYYLVGEYGPRTFRPHFHILLWFDREQTAESLYKCVHKSWKLGRIDIQKCRGEASSYVAGYLNSTMHLPSILKTSQTMPFAVHSQHLGEALLLGQKEEVYKLPVEEFIRRSINLDGTNSNFSLWRSVTAHFYPKCPRFSLLNTYERLTSYRTYADAQEWSAEISPFKQARLIIDSIIDNKWLDIPVVSYFKRLYNIDENIGFTDYQRVQRSIYMELRTSKHFLEFVCDGQDDIFHQVVTISMIEIFYKRCEALNLATQLEQEDEYIQEFDNLDDLTFFYHNTRFEMDDFLNLKCFRQFQETTLNKESESVKHKALNDLNGFWTQF